MNYLEDLWRRYLDQPHEVSFETQTLCNARCTFCPYPTLERLGTRMPDELIERIVEQLAAFEVPFYVSPFKLNEPLLDARVLPLCEHINREVPTALLRLFTNGQALTPRAIDSIAGLQRLAHLWISLNSHDPVEYERLMGLDFDKTVKRIDYLHTSDFPHPVMLSCVGYPNEAFRHYCFGRWPKFDSVAIKRDAWIDYLPSQALVPDTACGRWFELSITATGVVSHCCMDAEARFPIGNVKTQTLLEIYNAPFWRERRDKLLSRKVLDERSPCARCSY